MYNYIFELSLLRGRGAGGGNSEIILICDCDMVFWGLKSVERSFVSVPSLLPTGF